MTSNLGGVLDQVQAVPPPFDISAELPSGTTVLEASAGTGKTYTIAALAARIVAEGAAELSQLLLVTFGRMATNELRLRVRERLVAVESCLADAVAHRVTTRPLSDLEAMLSTGHPEELACRRARVSRALAEFDAATIATTHEFCLQMLDGLGVLGDREPHATVVEHLSDLTREVATDLYLRRYATTGSAPMSYEEALEVANQAVQAVHARLVPVGLGPDDPSGSGERVAFATAVREEVERRKRVSNLFTYDDMLTRLRDALADPERGTAAADRLRRRYRIVMVDEFQDTDPIQWEILHRTFHRHSTLILIGDPKQAIYAFRGADVFSYLDAVQHADQVRSLAVNRRSDQALVDALDELLGDTALGDERIAVRTVTTDHRRRRLRAPADEQHIVAPIRLRVMPHEPDAMKVPSVATIRPQIADDLVADITALLGSGAQLLVGGCPRPLLPSDIAVLVRKNERGEAIRDRLVAAGVPAVMYGASSVFASPMARDWLTLLLALEQTRQQPVRQAALTCFFGWTFADLAAANEESLIELTQRVRWWGKVLENRGVAALLETATADERLPERLLSLRGGERMLTDLRHLGQSLHAAMASSQLGVGALVEWLRARISEAHDIGISEGTRRLETDAKAVTILTVHRSKGLEFPIVYLPEAWDRHVNGSDEGRILRLHEPTATSSAECVLDVGGRHGPGRPERFSRYRDEEAGEDLRLLYVALTRAQCQVVTWWAPSFNTPASALQRFASRRPTDPPAPQAVYPLNGDPFTNRELGPGFSVETMTSRDPTNWQQIAEPPPALRVRHFDRELDLAWRRTSYSALTAAAHGAEVPLPAVGSEPESTREDDEAAPALSTAIPAEHEVSPVEGLDEPSPMHDLPSGVEFGTAVHAVFEHVDPVAADLPAALRQACALTLTQGPATTMTVDTLANALLPAFRTPLGPLADELRLCDIPRADRLAELGFEYPLTGGDVTNAEVNLGMVGPLLRRHLAPSDPFAGYPDMLHDPALGTQTLRGYLTGSIDAVFRIRRDDQPARYLVVDYKTNWLGSFDGDVLKVGDYTPVRMAGAMMRAHYPLQALLYAVAVHRMLRWRQPDYDPAVHLGGVLYLFVRGMAGPDTPRVDGVPCGVFGWRPPASLVVELSALLDGVMP
ncbi:MAG TPA: UvrD-helicase domain-containing protein [Propionibacteriaceae bacterium]